VAFDHQIFAQQRLGGISRYFCELLTRLPDEGIREVTIVAPFHVNEHLGFLGQRPDVYGRFVSSRTRGVGRFVATANRVVAPFAWSFRDADVLHETYYSRRTVGRSRARVVTVYDMIHELFPHEQAHSADETARKRAAVDRADHVICISTNTRDDLVRLFGVDPQKTSIVLLGSELANEESGPAIELPPSKPTLLFVGGRRGRKNFQLLLEAFASSKRLREDLEIVAFGGGRFSGDERAAIQKLSITDQVRHDEGDDNRLAAHYRKARLFAYPSRYEGFGIPPLEAMSQGCPVVCSRSSSIPEVVGDAGFYHEPDSLEDLRTALERVAFDDVLRARLKIRGATRANLLSWSRCAAATAEVYRSLR
jgi:glycosyltransferase involved in cell wall biosynthesis